MARDRVDLAVDRLLSSSLADDAGDGTDIARRGAIAVHTLVSRTMRFADASPDALAAWRERAVRVLTNEMAHGADIRQHSRLEPWVEHARELSASADDLARVDLLGRVARYDFERATYSLARSGYQQELDTRKRLQGGEHPATLKSMNNLANTLRNQGDVPGARRLQEAVLETQKRVLGEAHPDTLTSTNNLAGTLRNQGDLPGARRLQEALLETRKRVLGEEHPDTLTSTNNLAGTLRQQGEIADALRLQEASVRSLLRVLGAQHPDTVQCMQTLRQMGGDSPMKAG